MQYPEIDIHTHRTGKEGGSDVIRIASYLEGRDMALPEGPYAAGIHPWDAGKADPGKVASDISPCTVAIGETGLDFAREGIADRITQEKAFRAQLDIAVRLHLPVIVHCVKAYNEAMAILKDYNLRVVFHGFSGSPELARQLTDRGYYLAFGENLLRSPKTAEALKSISVNRIFLETDDSDLTISALYQAAAEVLNLEATALRKIIYENYERVFK